MTTTTPQHPPVLPLPAAVPVNRLLRTASWARERLRPFAGKTVCFNCVPFSVALTITENGTVSDAAADSSPAAEFTLTPGLALRALAADETAWREIRISGDNTLASAVAHVAQHLRWDAEEDLSRVFGDVAAHRMAQAGGELLRTQRQLFKDFSRAIADYLAQEQSLFASGIELGDFGREAGALRDEAEQLAKRVKALQDDR